MPEIIYDIDIKLLRIFRVVAKQKSFSLAADQLNTSLSNISTNMAQLESRLEMRLCERGVKGFRLTDQGRRVLEASEALTEAMRIYQQQVQSVAHESVREFRIGVLSETNFDAKLKLPEILAEIEISQPGTSFHIEVAPAARLKELVHTDDLHCAIGYFDKLGPPFESRGLYTERHLCYCGDKHPLFEVPYDSIDLKMLRDQRIAGYDDLADDEKKVVPLFAKYESCSRTNEGVLALILTGNYIGLLPDHYAQIWVEKGLIKAIDREELELYVDIGVLFKKKRAEELVLDTILNCINTIYPAV